MRIRGDTKSVKQDRDRIERQRTMTNDYFAEALQEVAPATDSIMAQVAKGQKVFAPRAVDVHAFDSDFDAKHQDKLSAPRDAFGYFG
jgi:hypothetical protein